MQKSKSYYSRVLWPRPVRPMTLASVPAPEIQHVEHSLAGPARFSPGKPVLDEIRALLKAAAEVEHSLLVQYLYAAYACTNDEHAWAILTIAIEEMGHLLTVQNLLAAVGGDPHFDRDDTSTIGDDFEPFPFVLEPPSAMSLAKYVLAEMPRLETLPETDQALIQQLQQTYGAGHGAMIRRVGQIYAALYWFFQETDQQTDPEIIPDPSKFPSGRHLSASDFAPAGIRFQSSPSDWISGADLRVIEVRGRSDALSAIREIAAQGEGLMMTSNSHYVRFRDLYRSVAAAEQAGHSVAKDVPVNPTTDPSGPAPSVILNPPAVQKAHLLDTRYQILVLCLVQGLSRPVDDPLRPTLLQWSLEEMQGNIRSLARDLTRFERIAGQSASPRFAGAAFSPLTAFPLADADRWRLQKQLIERSTQLTGTLSPVDRERLETVILPQINIGA